MTEPYAAGSNHPPQGTSLCRVEELPPAGRKFSWGEGATAFRIFVVRDGAEIRGFVNRCPHFHLPLDCGRNRFLSRDRQQILCLVHNARFRLEDGICTEGPCEGRALEPVEVAVVDGWVTYGPARPEKSGS